MTTRPIWPPAHVEVHGDRLILYVPTDRNVEQRRAVLDTWYRMQLREAIPGLISTWESKLDTRVPDWIIRRMRTKWGTCNTRDRRIWLNLELASMSLECLEYVVVHEMVHLLERGHTARFWRLMDTFLPRWREYRDELRTKPRPYVPR